MGEGDIDLSIIQYLWKNVIDPQYPKKTMCSVSGTALKQYSRILQYERSSQNTLEQLLRCMRTTAAEANTGILWMMSGINLMRSVMKKSTLHIIYCTSQTCSQSGELLQVIKGDS